VTLVELIEVLERIGEKHGDMPVIVHLDPIHAGEESFLVTSAEVSVAKRRGEMKKVVIR
jgi:hypothetical protein